jgi:hypothetical protein
MMIRFVAAVVGFLVFGLFASVSTVEASGRLGHGGARFFGLWEGIDAIDGSGMQRSIMEGADGTLKIVGRETFFSYCSTGTGIILGTGIIDGDRVLADQVLKCSDGNEVDTSATYRFNKKDRTLIETPYNTSVEPFVYHRINNRF